MASTWGSWRPSMPVPHILGVAADTLILQYVSGRSDWPGLGRAVARMHRSTGPAFGWHPTTAPAASHRRTTGSAQTGGRSTA
jgi:hypothetical protein